MASLPRLLPHSILRLRLVDWLRQNADYPLRLLVAPTGFGKTTGLTGYATDRTSTVYFVALRKPVGESDFLKLLGAAVDAPSHEYRDVAATLENRGFCEILIDGIEWLDAEATAILERLICEIPRGVGVVAAGTRTQLDVARYILRGFAAALPADAMLFSADEIAQLAKRLKFNATSEQLDDLLLRTDGWPIVVGDVMRVLEETATEPADAYEHWLAARGESFAQMMREELARTRPATRDAVSALVHGSTPPNIRPDVLLGDGAPVVPHEGGTRILRVLADVSPHTDTPAVPRDEPMRLRLFGRFTMRLGEREVQWIRRRDQQIFRYLLLQPDTTAAKADIIAAFWPEADGALAVQSLRTACSNIRKALVACIGPDTAERVFRIEGPVLRLDLSGAVVDLFRFKAHLAGLQTAENDGDAHQTLAHAAAAERIYKADLFSGEPPEAWYVTQRAAYREMCDYVVGRCRRLRLDLRIAQDEEHEYNVATP